EMLIFSGTYGLDYEEAYLLLDNSVTYRIIPGWGLLVKYHSVSSVALCHFRRSDPRRRNDDRLSLLVHILITTQSSEMLSPLVRHLSSLSCRLRQAKTFTNFLRLQKNVLLTFMGPERSSSTLRP